MFKNQSLDDAIIIGASISGITAAFLLGRTGKAVTILDPQAFPRNKACGEGLSIVGVNYLKSMGLWGTESESGAFPFYGYKIHFSDGNRIDLFDTRQAEPMGYGVSRLSLDFGIHQKVEKLNSVRKLCCAATRVDFANDIWSVTTNEGHQLKAKNLIVASGGMSVCKLFPGLCQKSEKQSKRFGLAFWCKGTWKGSKPKMVMIFNTKEGQYIITPLSSSRINVSMLINYAYSHASKKKSIIARAKQIIANAGFEISECSDCVGSPAIHSSSLQHNRHSAYFIGDAIERFDPIGGMGMTHGLVSAELCAENILKQQGIQNYYRQRSKAVWPIRLLTQLSYNLNSNHFFSRRLVELSPVFTIKVINLLKNSIHKRSASSQLKICTQGLNKIKTDNFSQTKELIC